MSDPTTFWVKFFTDAGIPTNEAANHAVTFIQNRITEDMLLDLTKEYLNGMNITMMGDVIAILKHAKAIVSQKSMSKLLKGVMINPITGTPMRTTAASRTVAHYLRSCDAVDSPKPISLDLASRLGTKECVSRSNSPNLVRLTDIVRSSQDSLPVPKFRRVLPEHEGKYKVTMPKGLTAKSRRLLAKSKKGKGKATSSIGIAASSESGSVFSRLGAGAGDGVASLGGKAILAQDSVFSRLGGAVKRPATSTVHGTDDSDATSDDGYDAALGYHGVLKESPAKRMHLDSDAESDESEEHEAEVQEEEASPTPKLSIKRTVNIMGTTAATAATTTTASDESAAAPSTQGIFSPFSQAAAKKPVNQRLGAAVVAEAQTTTSAPSSSAPTRTKATKTRSKKLGVQSRLGPPAKDKKSAVSISQNSTVFSRLGKQL